MTTIQEHGRDPGAIDHRGLSVLGLDECLRRIASVPVGRIAFHEDGEVVILPVNHVVADSMIAFRARWDSALASAVNDEVIAFEVDHYDPVEHVGWSVLVKGMATTDYDAETAERLETLLGVPWQGPQEETFWTCIRPEAISGRELGASREECGCC